MAPTVSVVMRVYNAERHLRAAVESVLAQTYRDFELLAIDDGSSDASAAILRGYAATDPRMRIVRQANGGKIAAAIRGLDEARGRYVAILDADDRAAPERLAAQTAFLDAHPEVVLVGSALGTIDERGRRVAVRRYPLDDASLRRAMPVYNPFAHSALMFRRETALAAGGYSRDFIIEDYDLSMRMMQLGRVANLPAVLAEYRLRTSDVDTRLVKVVLRGTIAARAAAHRLYGIKRTPKSACIDVAQRVLCLAPGALVNWICVRAFYRGA